MTHLGTKQNMKNAKAMNFFFFFWRFTRETEGDLITIHYLQPRILCIKCKIFHSKSKFLFCSIKIQPRKLYYSLINSVGDSVYNLISNLI